MGKQTEQNQRGKKSQDCHIKKKQNPEHSMTDKVMYSRTEGKLSP